MSWSVHVTDHDDNIVSSTDVSATEAIPALAEALSKARGGCGRTTSHNAHSMMTPRGLGRRWCPGADFPEPDCAKGHYRKGQIHTLACVPEVLAHCKHCTRVTGSCDSSHSAPCAACDPADPGFSITEVKNGHERGYWRVRWPDGTVSPCHVTEAGAAAASSILICGDCFELITGEPMPHLAACQRRPGHFGLCGASWTHTSAADPITCQRCDSVGRLRVMRCSDVLELCERKRGAS